MRRTCRNRGFSLLEMLVVLAIVALTLSVLWPQISGRKNPHDARQAGLQIAALARDAQTQAIRKGRIATLSVDLRNRRVSGDATSRVFTFPDTIAVTMTAARSDIAIAQLGTITFFPDGSTSGASLIISSGTQTFRLLIDWLTGATSLEKAQP